MPALKGVAKLYASVSKNRSPTYKKIVPKERVAWIHDLKAYLAELMGILEESDGRLKDLDEVAFKKDRRRVRELYFIIVSSLNVNGEGEDLKEIRAILSLNKYLKNKGLDLPLNFNMIKLSYIYYDEKKGVFKNCKLKNKCMVYKINGTSEEVMELFTMIYKDNWENAKREAD